MPQHQQFGVLGGGGAGEQHEQAGNPDEDQVEQLQRHGSRSFSSHGSPIGAGHRPTPTSGTPHTHNAVSVSVVVVAALAVSTGCGGDGDRTTACDEIGRQLKHLADRVVTADWQQQAKAYSETAAAVRRAGEKAGGDVEAAGNNLATYLETKSRKIVTGQDSDEGVQFTYNLAGVCP